MYIFNPYYTADGSPGLYNTEYNDIYHSVYGALTEAYEKFIYPIDFERLLKQDRIRVLDICYGLGYNTKCFLDFILKNYTDKKFFQKLCLPTKNIAKIYTDNIHNKKKEYKYTPRYIPIISLIKYQ